MIRNLVRFKVVIEGQECLFHFESNCTTNIVKQALFEGLKWIGQVEDQAKAKEEENKEKESVKPIENIEQETPQEEG